MSVPISLDYETFYSSKLKYSLKVQIAEQYCRHELFDPYLIAASDGETCWAGSIQDFNWNAVEGKFALAHNSYFDESVTAELDRRGWKPNINPAEWHCTANLTAFLCNRRSLDDAVDFLYKVKLDKSARSDANNKRWKDYSEPEQKIMLEYARRDAWWCHKLWTDHSHKWPMIERRLSQITIRQGRRGVQINTELLNQYICQAHEMKHNTEQVIPWIKDSEENEWAEFSESAAKPTSTKCIAEQCRRSGIPCPPVKSDDEEGYIEWEETYGPKYQWIAAVSAWRSINKLYKTFLTVKERLRSDGTLPFALKYFGAHCIPGEAEVLTKKGWIKLQEWSGGEIAQWCADHIIFKRAKANNFFVTEKMICVNSPYMAGKFTFGHTMPCLTHGTVKFFKCSAGEFTNRNSRWVPISGNLSQSGSINSAQMRLLVAVQADGCWETRNYAGGLQFTLRKARKIKRLKTLLNGLHIPFHLYKYGSKYGGQISIRIRRANCPEWLTPERKLFGSWLLDSTPEAREAFVEDLLLWDGHFSTREYYSSIKENVEWASTICHLTGRSMLVRKKPQIGNRKCHWAGVIRNTNKTLIFCKKHVAVLPETKRMVYCPTTETGFFLFRYRDKIAVTGNTGRWAGDARVNMQNMRKIPIFCNEHGLMETSEKREIEAIKCKEKIGEWPKWVRYAIDFRNLIIPRPGKRMITSDLSQIEPRVLAWLTGDTEMLRLLSTGMSPYEAHARSTMGWAGSKLKDENAGLYALAKARILALGYGAAWEKFIKMAMTLAGIDITADDPEFIEDINPFTGESKQINGYGANSKQIVKQFRDQNPKTTGLWKNLDEAFRRSVGEDFVMTLPSGRKMRYEGVRCETRIVPNKETKKAERKIIFTASIGGRRVPSYGGKLTENIVQAVARDVFAEHIVAIDDNGWENLFSCHDEAILEVDPDVTAEDVEQTMSKCPEWLAGCPIAAEAKVVEFYQK